MDGVLHRVAVSAVLTVATLGCGTKSGTTVEASRAENDEPLPLGEYPLGSWPDKTEAFEASKDCRHFAYIINKGEQLGVVLDDRLLGEYQATGSSWITEPNGCFRQATLLFSRSGGRLVFAAKTGGQWYVFVDGKPGHAFDAIGNCSISADGKHVAYAAQTGDKWMVVADGQTSRAYDEIGYGDPVLAPDGRHVAYAARTGGRWQVVLDSEPSSQYEEIVGRIAPLSVFTGGRQFKRLFNALFSPDSRHMGFVARKNRQECVVVDGKEDLLFDEIFTETLVFSANSRRRAYAARKGNRKSCVVVDGQPGPEYDDLMKGSPMFSPDGTRVAYVAFTGKGLGTRVRVVVDGQAGPEHAFVGFTWQVFSPDGKRVAYSSSKLPGGTMAVMLDGQRGPEYEVIGCWEPSVLGAGSPLFSPDSKRLAYMAARSEKQWVFVVDGVEGEPFDGFPIGQFLPGSRERNLFSPDSRRIAYAAGRGDKMHVVVDGKLSPLYETAGLEILFSPDSQHIAYSVKEKGRTHLVLDDDLGAAYDEIVGDPIFSNRNTFDYLARREGTLYRVSRAPRGHL